MIIVYKKLVQGLIYSPPDCDKYLALDAKPQGSVALALTLAPTVAVPLGGLQRHPNPQLIASFEQALCACAPQQAKASS